MSGVVPFDRARDLEGVLDLVGRARARAETGAIFHPGGLQWWLRRLGVPGFDVGVVRSGGDVIGLALRDRTDVLVQGRSDRTELLAWAEARVGGSDGGEMLVSVAEDDETLRRSVAARGYDETDRVGYELVYDLTAEPRAPELDPGFAMISLTPAIADAYVEMHRDAWTRPTAPSSYDRRQHDLVTAMPDFRYDLVPIVTAPDGTLAAYCMSWWDPRSASVEIEPLGTRPAFRRKRLARAIVREVFRRGYALGARYVLVWGTTSNDAALKLYLSAGMRSRRVLRDYRFAPRR